MNERVTYTLTDGIATIRLCDGKVNAIGFEMLAQLNKAFDRAEAAQAVVILCASPGTFCAGFDLKTMLSGLENAMDLTAQGFDFARRLLTFPTPVVCAIGGHAMAMGSYLPLGCDYVVGAEGKYKIGMNEVAIGMAMPHTGIVIAEDRLAKPFVRRAVMNAELFDPQTAKNAGFLHEVVAADCLMECARAHAERLSSLNMAAFAQTKLKSAGPLLHRLEQAVERDKKENFLGGMDK